MATHLIINEARYFTAQELFFSTTDRKGHIQRANRVFSRIAGYSWDELKDQPHNIIRHPDMPRAVFQLLWDYILEGRPVVAVVKNLARDGRYYWVVAWVIPIPDGFLSVRFKPTSPLLGVVQGVYQEMLALEQSIEAQSKDRKAAIAASTALLFRKLSSLGFSSYEPFMRHVMKQEMQSREAQLAQTSLAPAGAETIGPPKGGSPLAGAAATLDELVNVLNLLFRDLDAHVAASQSVDDSSGTLMEVSKNLRLSALNGSVTVHKIGSAAASLRPVLESLGHLSETITQESVHLAALLDDLTKEVELVVFGICAAKLQLEITAQFAHELVDQASASASGEGVSGNEGTIKILHASSREIVLPALHRFSAIQEKLTAVTRSQEKLVDSSRALRPIYLTGKIEMAAETDPRLAAVFKSLGEQLEETSRNLSTLRTTLDALSANLHLGREHGERATVYLSQLAGELESAVDSRL